MKRKYNASHTDVTTYTNSTNFKDQIIYQIISLPLTGVGVFHILQRNR